MIKYYLTFCLLFSLSFIACEKDDEQDLPQEDPVDQFLAGKTSGTNVIYQEIDGGKLTLAPDENSSDSLFIDMEYDGINDLMIKVVRMEDDSIKGVYLTSLNDAEIAMVDSTGNIQRFIYSETLDYDQSDYLQINATPLAQEITENGTTIETGDFNNLENQYFSITSYSAGLKYLGWVEVTVRENQRIYVYGYGTKNIPN